MPKNIEFQAKQTSNDSHDNLYEATVYTWGVKVRGASKLKHSVGAILFGGNVGHASIKLCFPADKRGQDLINMYCKNKNKPIPYETIVKQIGSNEKKTYISCYEIYFSAWPGPETKMYLNTLLDDQLTAIKGTNYNYKKHAPNYPESQIEHRISKGLLRKKNITLPPMLLIRRPEDNKSFTSEINKLLDQFEEMFSKIKNNQDEIYKLNLELKKINKSKKSPTTTIQQTINNINKTIEEKKDNTISLNNRMEKLYNKEQDLIKNYITLGKTADSKLYLPMIDTKNIQPFQQPGLDLENMLKTIRDIVDDNQDFELDQKNCSSTTLTILNSGILDKDRKWMAKHVPKVAKYLDKSAWLFKMLTPQSVYNAAYDMEKRIMRRKRITQPIKGLIKPGPVKNFISQLKIFKNLLLSINRDKYHKLTDTTDTGLEEQHLFFGFNNPLKTTKDQPTDTKTQKPSNQRDFR